MAVRSGGDYRESLAAMSPLVYLDGRVESVPDHPAFTGIIDSYADLYDMQGDDRLAFEEDGSRYAMSFLVPRTQDDLVRRRTAARLWAEYSGGMLGRTGDFLNAALTAFSQAGSWFADADAQFEKNMAAYATWVRENDILLTSTVGSPQSNRSVSAAEQGGGETTLRVVSQDSDGIVVSGARMVATNAPIANEILVMPQTVLRPGLDDMPYSFAFAVPADIEGLTLICRRPLRHGNSVVDEPLAARFEEIDAVCVFTNVRVPWDRVFLLGHPAKSNGMLTQTGATALMAHQSVTRTTVKTEFYAGLLSEMAEAIGIDRYDHVRDDLAQALVAVQMGKSALRAAEADGAVNEYGFFQPDMAPLAAVRNWFPRYFQTLPEKVRKFGASGLTALPYESDTRGDLEADIDRYLQGRNVPGHERVHLFNLGFDAAVSSFAGRQALYEYYFHGDPLRMSAAYLTAADTSAHREIVAKILGRGR